MVGHHIVGCTNLTMNNAGLINVHHYLVVALRHVKWWSWPTKGRVKGHFWNLSWRYSPKVKLCVSSQSQQVFNCHYVFFSQDKLQLAQYLHFRCLKGRGRPLW